MKACEASSFWKGKYVPARPRVRDDRIPASVFEDYFFDVGDLFLVVDGVYIVCYSEGDVVDGGAG